MKQRVVFLFYHGIGHVNAFLKAAKILQANNYEVYFAGSGFFHDHISRQGLRCYVLKSYPFGLGLEKWINTIKKKRNIYYWTLRDRITDSVFKEREVELYWMLEEIRPAILFIDILQATDFIVLYRHLKNKGIYTATVNTMLPTQAQPGHPPLNSFVFPTDLQSVSKAIRKMRWEKFKKRWREKLIYLGFDNSYIIQRRKRHNKIPQQYNSGIHNLLNFTVDRIQELILAPYEFEFPGFVKKSSQEYMGFMIDESRIQPGEAAFQDAIGKILATKRQHKLKLIFCSFGTIPIKQRQVTAALLKKLFSVASDEKFIIILSWQSDKSLSTNLPPNVHIFDSVPQLEVLTHTDVFITHGGLNSIKEAVYAEVPMLVYPVHHEYDPRGNAARVVYHGLGLSGEPETESIDNLRMKINTLLTDGTFKKNLLQLKMKEERYTGENFLHIVKHLMPLE